MHIFSQKQKLHPPFFHYQQADLSALTQNLKHLQKNYGRIRAKTKSAEARSQQIERERLRVIGISLRSQEQL